MLVPPAHEETASAKHHGAKNHFGLENLPVMGTDSRTRPYTVP